MANKRGFVFISFFHILENLTPDVGVILDIFFPLWRKKLPIQIEVYGD